MPNGEGKFIDRNPTICAAGKIFGDPEQTVARCLQDYRLESQVNALLHDAGIYEHRAPHMKYKLPKLQNYRHTGIYNGVREAVRPPVKTRYETLINDLKETSYESYWNKVEGRSQDPVPGLPAGMDTILTTYGKPNDGKVTAKDLLNPPKTTYQVLWDSQVGHELYIKTHNDYNPGEGKDRKYLKPAFNPNKRFGKRCYYDQRGIWVKCACNWCNTDPLTATNSIQADSKARQQPQCGKILAPNKNIEVVPKGHMFGKPSDRPLYGVEELLRDANCSPCIFKRDFHQWMIYLNQLRRFLKKRFNKFDFSFHDFHDHVAHYDKEHTGWVPLKLFYSMCECYELKYQYKCLEPFFKFCGVIEGENINYNDFIYLADLNKSVPEIIKIEDIPEGSKYYLSTQQSAMCDAMAIDNTRMKPAGVPSVRYDRLYPVVPVGGCRADLDSLGDETTAEAIVNPNIYSNYGLTYRDFFMPRSPEIIKRIFTNIGYEFPNDTFEKLWEIGVERDKTGQVCVDTFKNVLNEALPPPKLIVEEDI
ncbi:hypothetical protein RI129_005230 [Pyrocoelia pectoralis]|uniref:EFHB C-terminal EF-hand domain-containing protein n=1 Tax=Pyrocoelia pectoralis TaxID=417401 RepID=A0AAN7VJS8_9COLE